MKKSILAALILSATTQAETTITSTQGSKFIAYGVAGSAEEVVISSHSQQHKAIQSSLNWMEINCQVDVACKTYVRQDFQLTIDQKPSVIPRDLVIAFDAPTTRIDGTALPSSQLREYKLELYHATLATMTFVIPSVQDQANYEFRINGVDDHLCWSARAATVDINGLQSDWAFSPISNCEGE